MDDIPVRAHSVESGRAVLTARQHYADGIGWLNRSDVAAQDESRTRCAAMATAHFTAGQLALSIAAAERTPETGDSDG